MAKTAIKILIYRWKAYNQQDVENTFEKLGIDFDIYDIQPDSIESDENYREKLALHLKNGGYHFLFSINYFPILSQACHDTGVPYVCWTCDSPLLAMYHTSVFFDTNFLFIFDRHVYEEFKQAGCSHIFYLPLAPASDRINAIISNTTDYCYDVSFVGSLYEKNSYDPIADKLPDYLCGYIEGALQAQTLISGGNILPKLLTPDICEQLETITDYRQSEDSFSDIRLLFSTTVLGFKAASISRKQFLTSLAKYLRTDGISTNGVHLFTDSGDAALPFVNFHPPVDYHAKLPKVISQSKINLNMTIPNIQTGIPLRVWDILGSGGFLLTDMRQELFEHFTPGREFDIFEDEEELCFKTEYYLKHDDKRREMTGSAMECIKDRHSCTIRIKELLRTLKNYI